MNHEEFNILLQAYADNAMTQEQWERFRSAVQGGTFDAALEADFAAYLKAETIHPSWNEIKQQHSWKVIGERTGAAIVNEQTNTPEPSIAPVHRVHFLKTTWFRYAAAILLIITVVGIYYSVFHTSQPGTKVVQTVPPSVPDVLPGTNRATLTLSNGEQVQLDNATSETINDGNWAIGNENGELRYGADVRAAEPRDPPSAATRPLPPAGDRAVSRSTGFNTMSTPKGGQYKLTLADGTKVWLNAASSITYPVAFTGKSREVSITGEAYFEVSKNKEKPFIVTVAGSYPPLAEVAAKRPEVDRERSERRATYKIEVLGTTFNINSYPNEPGKTSLLEGAIKINNNILKPNQAFTNGKITTTNTTQDIAWKNGIFDFNGANLASVMRQVERWYDVEVEYKSRIPERTFYGELSRQLTLSQLLEILDVMKIGYEMQGRKIVIK